MAQKKKTLMEQYTDDTLLSSLDERVEYEVNEHDWGFSIGFRVGYVWADVMVTRGGEVTYGSAIDMPSYASNDDVNAVMEQGTVKKGVSAEKFLRGYTDSLAGLNDVVTAHYEMLGKFSRDLGKD